MYIDPKILPITLIHQLQNNKPYKISNNDKEQYHINRNRKK